jgi:DNA invertase Pin-like site-specific DNA recombinase
VKGPTERLPWIVRQTLPADLDPSTISDPCPYPLNLDLSTPSGRLMFNVIGAMAEFERALIQERVRAGLRNARAKGKRLGRPKVAADGRQVANLRKAGCSWSEVCKQTGLSKGTAQRAYVAQKSAPSLPKSRRGPISSSV